MKKSYYKPVSEVDLFNLLDGQIMTTSEVETTTNVDLNDGDDYTV